MEHNSGLYCGHTLECASDLVLAQREAEPRTQDSDIFRIVGEHGHQHRHGHTDGCVFPARHVGDGHLCACQSGMLDDRVQPARHRHLFLPHVTQGQYRHGELDIRDKKDRVHDGRSQSGRV